MPSNLVPKKITDKNGKQTTTYVRESETGDSNAKKLRGVESSQNRVMISKDHISREIENRGKNAKSLTVSEETDKASGAQEMYLVDPGEEYISGGIVRSNGEVVHAQYLGGPGEVELADGSRRDTWYAPRESPEHDDDVKLTPEEFEVFKKSTEQAEDMLQRSQETDSDSLSEGSSLIAEDLYGRGVRNGGVEFDF